MQQWQTTRQGCEWCGRRQWKARFSVRGGCARARACACVRVRACACVCVRVCACACIWVGGVGGTQGLCARHPSQPSPSPPHHVQTVDHTPHSLLHCSRGLGPVLSGRGIRRCTLRTRRSISRHLPLLVRGHGCTVSNVKVCHGGVVSIIFCPTDYTITFYALAQEVKRHGCRHRNYYPA